MPYVFKKVLLPFFAVALILGLSLWLTYMSAESETVATTEEPSIATTTIETLPTPNDMSERWTALPEGAIAIDEYAYANDGRVFFKSLTGKSALDVADARATTFKRLSDFKVYTHTDVIDDCNGSAIYAYYGDGNRIYFYQVWKTSTFHATRVDGVTDVDAQKFVVASDNATDNKSTFSMNYIVTESGTCRLELMRSSS